MKLPPLRVTCHWLERWVSPGLGSEKALPFRVAVVAAIAETPETEGVFGEALGVEAVVKLYDALQSLQFPALSR
jgi:hypothetical protein